MPWFVKIEKGIVEKPEFDQHIPAHKAYVKELIANGHQARSGYWAQRGGGMMILQAESLEEAKAIVAKDPLIQNGCVQYQLYQWQVVVE